MASAEQLLKKYWGHELFRFPQAEIIEAVVEGKDTFALLPTGGGKSVCFQIPTLMMDGLCLVITPLIALMQDQVQQLKSKGIKASVVHSGMTRREIDVTLDNCVYGSEKFLYLSPERLQTEIFRERLKKMKVCLVAIDEAHCISQWGYDFRPPYLQIAELREILPKVPFIALTASATRAVKDDIIQKLNLKAPAVFQKSFARENISFVVRKTENKEKQLLDILRKVRGSSIVYVRSRKATKDLAAWLTGQKIAATFYHAGLDHGQRKIRQAEWQEDRVRVIVATNAFGMGINKVNVRTVVHVDLPENPESYYQEAGRAGRDGHRSYAVLIFHAADIGMLRSKVAQSNPGMDLLKQVYQALANYYQLAIGSGQNESRDFDLDDFCKRFSLKSAAVFPALKKMEEQGLIQLSDSFYRPSKLHFSIDKKQLYEFQVGNAKYDPFIKTLLRLYGGELFSNYLPISETQIAQVTQWTEKEVKAALLQLSKLQLVNYEPASESPQLTFVLPRQDADHLPVDKTTMEERRKLSFAKMEAMVSYVDQAHRCRMQWIQDYFDEITEATCGICDVCIEKKKKENLAALQDYESQILYLLKQKPMTVEELEESVDPDERELFLEVIREMVDRAVIGYDEFWVLKKLKDQEV
jgi:ATP-dependent DNA helicase RecQ